jgi:RHS repeat-associated protein
VDFDGLGPKQFDVYLKDGRIERFGDTPSARLEGSVATVLPGPNGVPATQQGGPGRYAWELSSLEDRSGNAMKVDYVAIGGELAPNQIAYTFTADGMFPARRAVTFTYGPRIDTVEQFVGGLRLATTQRLEQIDVTGPAPALPGLLRRYKFSYAVGNTGRSLLQRLYDCDGADVCAQRAYFEWSTDLDEHAYIDTGIHDDTAAQPMGSPPSEGMALQQILGADLNADGCDDLLYKIDGQWKYRLSLCYDQIALNHNVIFEPPEATAGHSVTLPSNAALHLVDMDLDGRADVVTVLPPIQKDWMIFGGTVPYLAFPLQVYLASTISPASWTPSAGLFADTWSAEDDGLLTASTDGELEIFACESPACNGAVLVGDMNADGRPDLVTGVTEPEGTVVNPAGPPLTPFSKWWLRLNSGRTGDGTLMVPSQALDIPNAKSPPRYSGQTPTAGALRYLGQLVMVDVDGNGTADPILRSGSGPTADPSGDMLAFALGSNGMPSNAAPVGEVAPEDRFAYDLLYDVNGDGLSDIVSLTFDWSTFDAILTVSLNSGSGGFLPAYTALSTTGSLSDALNGIGGGTNVLPIIWDYDGDGKGDMLVQDSEGNRYVTIRGGIGPVVPSLNAFNGPSPIPIADSPLEAIAMDVNGDGLQDFVEVVGGDIHVLLTTHGKRDMLTGVVEGGGASTYITYQPITSASVYSTTEDPGAISDYPEYLVQRGLWVVQSYKLSQPPSDPQQHGFVIGPPPLNEYDLSYTDGRTDLLGLGWQGFATRTVQDLQTYATTVTTYDNKSRSGSLYLHAHKPSTITTTIPLDEGEQQVLQQTTTFEYEDRAESPGASAVLLRHIVQDEREGGLEQVRGLAPQRHIDTVIQHDSFGNASLVTRTTGDGFTDITSTPTYLNDPVNWLIGVPTLTTQESKAPNGDDVTRTTAYDPDPATGLLRSRTVEPNGDAYTYLQTTYDRDGYGLLRGVDSLNLLGEHRSVTINVDPAEHMLPTSITNALGFTTLVAIHPGLGVTGAVLDPQGVLTTMQYDGFGRFKAESPPDGDSTKVTYVGNSISVQQASGQLVSVGYDGYGHEILRTSLGFGNEWIRTGTGYTPLGQVAEVVGPCVGAVYQCDIVQKFSYDAAGRVRFVTRADGSQTEHRYGGLTTTALDENRRESSSTTDQLGRVAASSEQKDDGTDIVTTFAIGAFGQVRNRHFTNGGTGYDRVVAYDVRGRQSSMSDPDSGKSTFQYNAFDELDTRVDAAGRTTTVRVRDGLGRPRVVDDSDGTTTLTWDSAAHGIGQLASEASSDGVVTNHSYDPIGRPSGLSWSTGTDPDLTVSWGFDPEGRLGILTYGSPPSPNWPTIGFAPVTVRYDYTDSGYVRSITDTGSGTVLWQGLAQNPFGQLTSEQFGNGITRARVFDSRARLKHIVSASGGGSTGQSTVQDIAYDYYANSDVQAVTDAVGAVAQGFSYDAIDRLVEWTVSAQSTSTLDEHYKYDDIGNLLHRWTTTGSDEELVFSYTGPQPHFATQVNGDSFTPDPAGDEVAGGGRSTSYTAFDLPKQITTASGLTTRYSYDASHTRISKLSVSGGSGEQIYYAGEFYEVHEPLGGSMPTSANWTRICHIRTPGGATIEMVEPFTESPGATTYVLPDALGSVETVVDPAGNVAHRKYDPYGGSRNPTNPAGAATPAEPSILAGFTGQEDEFSLGLVNMRGRIYDPRRSRFLTPDPYVAHPLSSQGHNRYGYALNNPLRWVDPSGFDEEEDGENEELDSVESMADSSELRYDGTLIAENSGDGALLGVDSPRVDDTMANASPPPTPPPLVTVEEGDDPARDWSWGPWDPPHGPHETIVHGARDPNAAGLVGEMTGGTLGNRPLAPSSYANRLFQQGSPSPMLGAAMLTPSGLGRIFQNLFAEEFQLAQNTIFKWYSAVANTVPDLVGWDLSIIEVKYVEVLKMTSQLQAQLDMALEMGQKLNFLVGPHTEVTQPILYAVEATGGRVVAYDPATGVLMDAFSRVPLSTAEIETFISVFVTAPMQQFTAGVGIVHQAIFPPVDKPLYQ